MALGATQAKINWKRDLNPAREWVGTSTHQCFLGTERFFRPGYAANLVAAWIPSLEDVDAKLKAGARVADVGCGLGASTDLDGEELSEVGICGIRLSRQID